MKRIINMALIALTLSGGVALADRDHGRGRGRDTSNHQGGTVVTPTYRNDRVVRTDRRYDNRRYDNRRYDNRSHVRVQRVRPTFRNNRFYFAGGNYQTYQRPVIQYRYRNYYQRPALVVENIQPVAGYIWIQGNWQWDGYEWQWTAGHYEVDQSYQDSYESYDNGYYAPSSGISVQGSWNF